MASSVFTRWTPQKTASWESDMRLVKELDLKIQKICAKRYDINTVSS